MSRITNEVLYNEIKHIKDEIIDVKDHLKTLNGKVIENTEFRLLHCQDTETYRNRVNKALKQVEDHNRFIDEVKWLVKYSRLIVGAIWVGLINIVYGAVQLVLHISDKLSIYLHHLT